MAVYDDFLRRFYADGGVADETFSDPGGSGFTFQPTDTQREMNALPPVQRTPEEAAQLRADADAMEARKRDNYLQGVSYFPERLVGAPVDIASMVGKGAQWAQGREDATRALVQGTPQVERQQTEMKEHPVGGSDWMLDMERQYGIRGASSGTTEEERGDLLGQFIDPTSGIAHAGALAAKGIAAAGHAIPATKLAIFAGAAAKTADLAKLAKAQELEAAGESAEAIHAATGWFRGADTKWRFEIDDSKSAFNAGSTPTDENPIFDLSDHGGPNVRQGAAADVFSHDDAYAAYPELKDKMMELDPDTYGGGFYPDGTIQVGVAHKDYTPRDIGEAMDEYGPGALNGMSDDGRGGAPRKVALHELQHAIQKIEGWEPGANPLSPEVLKAIPALRERAKELLAENDQKWAAVNAMFQDPNWEVRNGAHDALAKVRAERQPLVQIIKTLEEGPKVNGNGYGHNALVKGYNHNAGEVEARNVMDRADMTPGQRSNSLPSTTEDTRRDLQWTGTGAGTKAAIPPDLSEAEFGNKYLVHLDMRPGAADRVESMMTEGLKHGSAAPMGPLKEGVSPTAPMQGWHRSNPGSLKAGAHAYIYPSNAWKKGAGGQLKPGSKPVDMVVLTRDGQTPYEALRERDAKRSIPDDKARRPELPEKGPVTAYHGGAKLAPGEYHEPTFFTTDPKGAEWYAQRAEGTVNEVELHHQKPLVLRGKDEGYPELIDAARKAGVKVDVADGPHGWTYEHEPTGPLEGLDVTNPLDLLHHPEVREQLRKKGYDSVVASDPLENGEIPTIVPLDKGAIRAKGPTTEHAMAIERQERRTVDAKNVKLTDDEKAWVGKLPPAQAAKTAAEIRRVKARYPVSDGWEPMTARAVTFDEKTGEPVITWKAAGYGFNQTKGDVTRPLKDADGNVLKEIKRDADGNAVLDADGNPIPTNRNQMVTTKETITPRRGTKEYDRWVNRVADKSLEEIRQVIARANMGDADAQVILRQAGWYRETMAKGFDERGGAYPAFADLLGATSPNTSVDQNYRYAVDLQQKHARGKFDDKVDFAANYGGNLNDFPKDQLIRREGVIDPKTGEEKQFGMNSRNAQMALADRWTEKVPGQAPKARNFSGNLGGQTDAATIDVWAARHMNRMAGRKRLPPPLEAGVGGSLGPDLKSGGEFGFGQDAYAKLAEKLNKSKDLEPYLKPLGYNDVTPMDLQALTWFIEKEHWGKNNWTTKAGEGGSFEDEMQKFKTERWQAGHSIQTTSPPSDEAMAAARKQIEDVLRDDNDVRVYRSHPTYGMYGGDVERSFDTEVSAKPGWDPTRWKTAIVQQAKDNGQKDVFFSKRLSASEASTHPNARPGVEIYFGSRKEMQAALPALEEFTKRGTDGFTFVTDLKHRERMSGGKDSPDYVGVRLQWVPEISMRWDSDMAHVWEKNPKELMAARQDAVDRMQEALDAIDRRGHNIVDARVHWYDSEVLGMEDYDAFLEGHAARQPAAGNEKHAGQARKVAPGRSLHQNVKARNRSLGAGAQDGLQDTGGALDLTDRVERALGGRVGAFSAGGVADYVEEQYGFDRDLSPEGLYDYASGDRYLYPNYRQQAETRARRYDLRSESALKDTDLGDVHFKGFDPKGNNKRTPGRPAFSLGGADRDDPGSGGSDWSPAMAAMDRNSEGLYSYSNPGSGYDPHAYDPYSGTYFGGSVYQGSLNPNGQNIGDFNANYQPGMTNAQVSQATQASGRDGINGGGGGGGGQSVAPTPTLAQQVGGVFGGKGIFGNASAKQAAPAAAAPRADLPSAKAHAVQGATPAAGVMALANEEEEQGFTEPGTGKTLGWGAPGMPDITVAPNQIGGNYSVGNGLGAALGPSKGHGFDDGLFGTTADLGPSFGGQSIGSWGGSAPSSVTDWGGGGGYSAPSGGGSQVASGGQQGGGGGSVGGSYGGGQGSSGGGGYAGSGGGYSGGNYDGGTPSSGGAPGGGFSGDSSPNQYVPGTVNVGQLLGQQQAPGTSTGNGGTSTGSPGVTTPAPTPQPAAWQLALRGDAYGRAQQGSMPGQMPAQPGTAEATGPLGAQMAAIKALHWGEGEGADSGEGRDGGAGGSSDLPAGMRNNNPGNLKYSGSDWQQKNLPGIVGPSTNRDQGTPQVVFSDAQNGMNAAARLAIAKYNSGMQTVGDLVAGKGGWTPGNTRAAANIAATMGVKPSDPVDLSDPGQMSRFLGAVTRQEQGDSSKAYTQEMYDAAAQYATRHAIPTNVAGPAQPGTAPGIRLGFQAPATDYNKGLGGMLGSAPGLNPRLESTRPTGAADLPSENAREMPGKATPYTANGFVIPGDGVYARNPDGSVMGYDPKATPQGGLPAQGVMYNLDRAATADKAQYANAHAKPIEGIVTHHTGHVGDGSLNAAMEYGYKADPGRSGVMGYSFYAGPDGNVVQARPLEERTNHVSPLGRTAAQGLQNTNTYGVSAVADDDSSVTPAQRAAQEQVTRDLVDYTGIDARNVYGHGELQANRQGSEGRAVAQAVRDHTPPSSVPTAVASNAPAPAQAQPTVSQGYAEPGRNYGQVGSTPSFNPALERAMPELPSQFSGLNPSQAPGMDRMLADLESRYSQTPPGAGGPLGPVDRYGTVASDQPAGPPARDPTLAELRADPFAGWDTGSGSAGAPPSAPAPAAPSYPTIASDQPAGPPADTNYPTIAMDQSGAPVAPSRMPEFALQPGATVGPTLEGSAAAKGTPAQKAAVEEAEKAVAEKLGMTHKEIVEARRAAGLPAGYIVDPLTKEVLTPQFSMSPGGRMVLGGIAVVGALAGNPIVAAGAGMAAITGKGPLAAGMNKLADKLGWDPNAEPGDSSYNGGGGHDDLRGGFSGNSISSEQEYRAGPVAAQLGTPQSPPAAPTGPDDDWWYNPPASDKRAKWQRFFDNRWHPGLQ